jgi:hypothetical protein
LRRIRFIVEQERMLWKLILKSSGRREPSRIPASLFATDMKPTIVSRQLKLMAVCAAGLLAGLSVQAAETPKSGLAIAVEQAWRLNPQAAGLDAREAEARAAQDVAAGLTPEPGSVSIGSLNDRLNRNQGKQEYEVELAVPLWLPGQKAAREAEAASRIDEAVARRTAVRLEVSGELREAWWALATARSAKILAARRLETARALETDVMRRYKVGELSRIDANLAQTETHAANAELVEAEATLLQAEQAVQTLTGSPAPKIWTKSRRRRGELIGETGDSAETHPLLAATAAAARSARARVQVADESRRAAPELALRVVRERGDFAEPIPTAWASSSRFRSRPVPRCVGKRRRHRPRRTRPMPTCCVPRPGSGSTRSAHSAICSRRNASWPWRRNAVSFPPRTCGSPRKPFRWANPIWRPCCAFGPPPSMPMPFSTASVWPVPPRYRV